MNHTELVGSWALRVQRLKIGHYTAASRFERRSSRLGVVVIIVAALAPAISYLSASYNMSGDWRFVVATATLLFVSGMLATLQIFLRDSERAEKHRAAGATYAKLEMDIEKLLAFMPSDPEAMHSAVESFRDEWSRVTGGSPVIPQDIYDRQCAMIETREALRAAG